MRRINKWFNPAAKALVDLDLQFEELERSFEAELSNTYRFSHDQSRRSQFIKNELVIDQFLDTNNIIEGFILAVLLLFSALEEADWLCFSANTKSEDLIEDESSWNIYKLFTFIPLLS